MVAPRTRLTAALLLAFFATGCRTLHSSKDVNVRINRLNPSVFPPTDPEQVVLSTSAPTRPTLPLAHIITTTGSACDYDFLCERTLSEAAAMGAEWIVTKTEKDLRSCSCIGVAYRFKESGQGVARHKSPSTAEVATKSDVDVPSYRLPERPHDFALVVGIEGYASIQPAELAERDARAVRDHLIALGYPERNVIHLAGPEAGRAAIAKYVESWLPLNVTEKSRVFVYFAGRGAPDFKTRQAYLLPWDGDPRYLKNTGYPLRRLYEKLGALKAREVLIVLDTSFSGTGERSALAKGTRPLVTQVEAGAAPNSKVAVLSACSTEESAAVLRSQGHGLFTYYLLKALNGAAADSSGQVTLRSLFKYVSPNVQDEASRQNRKQTPTIETEFDLVIRSH